MRNRDGDLRVLAQRLRMARASSNMTQGEVAKASGISQSALSLYEQGRREPMAMAIKRLSITYGVSMDWLMGLSNEMATSADRQPDRGKAGTSSQDGWG